MKYKHKDFKTILDAFVKVSSNFMNNEVVSVNDLIPLCDYPVDVLEEFLKAMGAVSPKQIDESAQAVEVYVLLRMNVCGMTRKPLDF